MWVALTSLDYNLKRILGHADAGGLGGQKSNYYLEDILDNEGEVQLRIAEAYYKQKQDENALAKINGYLA